MTPEVGRRQLPALPHSAQVKRPRSRLDFQLGNAFPREGVGLRIAMPGESSPRFRDVAVGMLQAITASLPATATGVAVRLPDPLPALPDDAEV